MGRKYKLENRNAILKASYHLFMAYGYDNVSVLDIEKESHVQTRGFYRYFKNKDEILGTIIETIEKKMLEYMQPVLTDDYLLTFSLFTIMKIEYALANPHYFRMNVSLIAHPDTFIKSFMELYELSSPQESNWRSDELTMLQGLYIMGGILLVQYGFIKNISGTILSNKSAEFILNYDVNEFSEESSQTYRRFMHYALQNNLIVLGLKETDAKNMINTAYLLFDNVNVDGFKDYFESELGF